MNTLKSNLDPTDWAILCELQQDARLSYAEIGRRVGLSSPAVQERIHKLEDANIITGYCAQINTNNIGLPIRAIIQMKGSCRDSVVFKQAVLAIPQVLQCHHVLGENCFFLQVAVESMAHLESLIESLYEYGETETTMILTTPVEKRIISPTIFQHESEH